MASININARTAREEQQRAQVLQKINDKLSIKELERLGNISDSAKGRKYLNGQYWQLKSFLKL